jgi:hypothetical protein
VTKSSVNRKALNTPACHKLDHRDVTMEVEAIGGSEKTTSSHRHRIGS